MSFVTLFVPECLQSVQTDDGSVFVVDSTRRVEVPERYISELIVIGCTLAGPRPETVGPQGLRGELGPEGSPGEKGVDGLRGIEGAIGPSGASGPTGPTGPTGPKGGIGPMPKHEWQGTELRFEIAPNKWGRFVDLQGPQGADGYTRVIHGGGGSGGGGVGLQGPPGPTGPPGSGSGGGDGTVPYFLGVGETFTVPLYRQALFARTIDCEGIIDLAGDLVLVN